jgi:hypothetical protein
MTHTEKVGDKDYYFFSLSPKTVFFDVKKCATCRDRVLFEIIVVALFDIKKYRFLVKKTLPTTFQNLNNFKNRTDPKDP